MEERFDDTAGAHNETAELQPADEPFLLCPSGSAGRERSRRHGNIHEIGASLAFHRLLEQSQFQPSFQFHGDQATVQLGTQVALTHLASHTETAL